MLLFGLIALWIGSIVVFFAYAHKTDRDGVERISAETTTLGYSLLAMLVLSGTFYAMREVFAVESSIFLESITLFAALAILESATWFIILVFEFVAWAIRKLVCNIILRIYGIVESPKPNSRRIIFGANLTDASIRETLNFCKYGSDTLSECLEFGKCDTFTFS